MVKSKAWINIMHLCLVAFRVWNKMAHKKVRDFESQKNCRRGDSTVLKAKSTGSADMIGPGENFIVTGILWNAKSWIQIICLH